MLLPNFHSALKACILSLIATNLPSSANADTPLGWINSETDSAYTTSGNSFQLSIATLAVNEQIDFLDVREDLKLSNRALVGNSGDLDGKKLSLHLGIFDWLSLYGHYKEHALTVDLGEINSLTVIDIDKSLDTTQSKIGIKWLLYESDLLAADRDRSALSLDLQAYENESDNYDVTVSSATISDLVIAFRDPQTFSVDRLSDSGWSAKLRYTTPLQNLGTWSISAGFGKSRAKSGTTSDLTSATFARFFEQEFQRKEKYWYAGIGLHYDLTARLPIDVSYEYIRLASAKLSSKPESPPAFLPSFLSANNQSQVAGNHTLKARVSYWLMPRVYLSLTGNLYSNQFTGNIPHYNNPLSGSFSSLPYGFIGLELGINHDF